MSGGKQEGTPCKLVIFRGGSMLNKFESQELLGLLLTLKGQVIPPLQLCRKEQEGTCDFEGEGGASPRKNRVPDMGGNGVKNNRIQELRDFKNLWV